MPLILPQRRTLAYPAGRAPGIDQTHPAAVNLKMSAVAIAGPNFIDLRGGTPFEIGGAGATPPAQTTSIGPIIDATGASGYSYNRVTSGAGFTTPTVVTGAVIGLWAATGGLFVSDDNGNFLAANGLSGVGGFVIFGGFGTPSITAGLSTGTPVFVIVSASTTSGQPVNFLVKNLATGQVFTNAATNTGAGYTGTFSKVYLGSDFFKNISGVAVAAGMLSYNLLSMPQMLQWAEDPWSFWYPPTPRKVSYFYNPTPDTTTTSGVRLRQRWNCPSLAYPAGRAPGIDMAHPAAANLRFSGIASGGNNFVNLMTGAKGVLTSTPTFGLHGTLGPTLNSALNSNQSAAFSGLSTANDALLTFAVMTNYNSISAFDQNVFTATSNFGTGGCFLKLNATTGVLAGAMNGAGGFDASPLAGVPGGNVPLFILVSFNFVSAIGNWLFRRLDTGQVQSISKGLAVGSTAGNGSCVVGDIVTNGFTGTNGGMAAAMYSAQFMTMPQMLTFANDPWSFWYPRQTQNLIVPTATPIVTATQYAAFCTPQRDGAVYTQMTGY